MASYSINEDGMKVYDDPGSYGGPSMYEQGTGRENAWFDRANPANNAYAASLGYQPYQQPRGGGGGQPMSQPVMPRQGASAAPYGGAQDYYRQSMSSSGGSSMPAMGMAPQINLPKVGDYYKGMSSFGNHSAASGMQNGAGLEWSKMMQTAGPQFQADLAARAAAQKQNYDMAQLAFQAQLQDKNRMSQETEAQRNRDQQLLMQARGFENDDYSSAKQQFQRYGLGGYF